MLAACQPSGPAEPLPTPTPTALGPATHPPGATLHYLRSNQDGSKPERILVHVVSDHELAVAKMVERCTSAALVTAFFDAERGEAIRLVGGRLQADGGQLPQASLDYDMPSRRIDFRLGDLTGPVSETVTVPASPWRLYDFDFAEFALFGPRDTQSRSYGYAITWPDGPAPSLRQLGEAQLVFMAAEGEGEHRVNRFKIEGPAFGAKGGEITFDARYGHVVEAKLGAPNHGGYTDYMLRLQQVVPGNDAWRTELSKQFENCPPT
jgi:hypothetical protein